MSDRRLSALAWKSVLLVLLVLGSLGLSYRAGRRSWLHDLQQATQEAIRRSDPDAASMSARAAAELAPAATDDWKGIAGLYQARGDYRKMVDALGQVPATDPQFITISLLRADILFSELEQAKEAERIWLDVLERDPLSAQGWQRLIYVYAVTLRRTDMMRAIRRAALLKREPREAYAYATAMMGLTFSDGLVRTLGWTKRDPDDESLLVARAIYLASAARRTTTDLFPDTPWQPGSLEPLKECRERFPRNIEILCYLLEAAVQEGDVDQARTLLEGVEAPADEARIVSYRAWVLATDRKFAEADEAFACAVAINPLDWRTRHQWASVLRTLGQKAKSSHEAAIGIQGKALERRILALPTAADADEELMREVARYFADCGESELLAALQARLE